MELHIGQIIQKQVKISALTNAEFARQIDKFPQNIKEVFGKKSIDTDLLYKISVVLKHNFFTYYTVQLSQQLDLPPDRNFVQDQGTFVNKTARKRLTISYEIDDPNITTQILNLIQ
ncbi:hypothetical protein [Pedobacter jeongneungensis]|uniref:hypothetical protein n=1 Tax=Pedobacter jeongneungensis TaxID=947309 RepID=UPI0004684229|nr:hypothetical protein [Pedobacter jeongneungensis]